MQTKNETYLIEEDGWTVRVRPPKRSDSTPKTLLMLHGLMGDENVMWIFTRQVPENTWIFAPRAPLQAGSGYAWLPTQGEYHSLEDFAEPAEQLVHAFDVWITNTGAPRDRFDVMGFSQGAAMSFALAAFYPQRVNRILALAGFAPQDVPPPGRYSQFVGKEVFISHGTKDQIIPISVAQRTVKLLEDAGAKVTYCESETGHKMSASCLRGVEAFFD